MVFKPGLGFRTKSPYLNLGWRKALLTRASTLSTIEIVSWDVLLPSDSVCHIEGLLQGPHGHACSKKPGWVLVISEPNRLHQVASAKVVQVSMTAAVTWH